ncbi:MAG: ATP-dependent helicase, partial [Myxococcota bacterium]|nr:ATP-dependent helicase [Myxococcota bacterium]
RVDALDEMPTAARDGCRALERIVSTTRAELFAGKRPPSEVARDLCARIELKQELDANAGSAELAAKRWRNVEWVLATLARREAREGAASADRPSWTEGLAAFLQALTLDLESLRGASEDPAGTVTLSTLHGSKGLEFEVVFLIGCEEGYLPHARTLDARATDLSVEARAIASAALTGEDEGGAADIEEERRLFYVGVTRARERLFLSRARARVLRGKSVPRTPSRFLLDVPPELLDEVEVKDEAPTTAREAAANAEAILALLQSTRPVR